MPDRSTGHLEVAAAKKATAAKREDFTIFGRMISGEIPVKTIHNVPPPLNTDPTSANCVLAETRRMSSALRSRTSTRKPQPTFWSFRASQLLASANHSPRTRCCWAISSLQLSSLHMSRGLQRMASGMSNPVCWLSVVVYYAAIASCADFI